MNSLAFLYVSLSIVFAIGSGLIRHYFTKKHQQKYVGNLVGTSHLPAKVSKVKTTSRFSLPSFDKLVHQLHRQYDVPKDLSVPQLIFIQFGLLFICWNISGFLKISFLPLIILAGCIEIAGIFFFLKKRRLIDQFDKAFPQLLDAVASVYQIHPDLKQSLEYSKELVIDPTSKRFLSEVTQLNQIGVPTVQSLEIMATKWQYAPLSFLISSIKLHQTSGGNLAQLFQQTAQSFRRQQTNKKAMQSVMFQNKISSLVVSSLVPIILLLSLSFSASYRNVMVTEPMARTIIIVAGVWWAIGVIVLWRALRVRV